PPERPDEIPAILEKIKQGERVEHYETIRLARDGRRIDISLTVSPICDDQGQVLGASAISRDITEQRIAQETLRQSEELFTKAFYASPAGLVITNLTDGKYIDANESYLRMLEYSRAD